MVAQVIVVELDEQLVVVEEEPEKRLSSQNDDVAVVVALLDQEDSASISSIDDLMNLLLLLEKTHSARFEANWLSVFVAQIFFVVPRRRCLIWVVSHTHGIPVDVLRPG